jgi:hypothetical protein
MRQLLVRSVVVLLMALVLCACAPSSTQGPMTWLDQPLDRARLALEPQEVTAHASDTDGVASLEFYVDGALLAGVPVGGGMLADATVGWNPSAPGVYTISAKATDSQGNTGPEATAVVTVGELEGSPTPLATVQPTEEIVTQETPSPGETSSPVPTSTPIPPTRQPTSVPPTLTPVPPSPTLPPRAPQIAYFVAEPSTINAGQCSTLSWGVEYAAEVYLDGAGVFDHDTRQVCPPSTTTYVLYARSPGGEQSASVTVTVIEPPTPTPTATVTEVPTPTPTSTVVTITPVVADFDAPYVSNLDADPDSITANWTQCSGGQTTVSVFADDPSGVASVVAHWTLESQSGDVQMTPYGGGVYRAVLGPFSVSDVPRNLLISFVARDTVGNSSSPPVGPITVVVYAYCLG